MVSAYGGVCVVARNPGIEITLCGMASHIVRTFEVK